MTEDTDNPVVSLAIGLVALGLILVGCMALRSTKDTKIAVRPAQGPSLPSHGQPENVCVGPECEIPGVPAR